VNQEAVGSSPTTRPFRRMMGDGVTGSMAGFDPVGGGSNPPLLIASCPVAQAGRAHA
jgi:hypothetical protein